MEVSDAVYNSQSMSDDLPDSQSLSPEDASSPPSPHPSPSPASQSGASNSSFHNAIDVDYDVGDMPPDMSRRGGDASVELESEEDGSSDEQMRGNPQNRRRRLESNSESSEDENDGLEEPKRKLKDPSPVWECGAVRTSDGAKCGICGKLFQMGNSRSTSNISRHILRKHEKSYEAKKLQEMKKKKKTEKDTKDKEAAKKKAESKQFKQSSLFNFVQRSAPIDPMKKKRIDNALVKHVVIEKEPFDLVEKTSFRELLYTCEPSYICPSRSTITRNFDNFALEVAATLKKEINEDLSDVPDKVINITSDHGTSHDNFRSKKNVVSLSRCTKDYEIKTDTVGVIKCEGPQNGNVIRKDVKTELEKVGYDESWKVNWVTDSEAKQINARAPGKHPQVGLETYHTANCTDHVIHLAVEESLEECPPVKESVDTAHKLVNKMKDSANLREEFSNVMVAAGANPLSMMKGTLHRWFHKWMEVNRVLILREHVEKFQEEFEDFPVDCILEAEDWRNLLIYSNSMKTLVEASSIFEGEKYPTASSVIPFLDQVVADLTSLLNRLPNEEKTFPRKLLMNLKSERRFGSSLYTDVTPFNCLTVLDPRYMDIYLSEELTEKAFADIAKDVVFRDAHLEEEPTPVAPQIAVSLSGNSFALRRAQLMATKQAPQAPTDRTPATLKQKLTEEKDKFLALRGTVDLATNPQIWWKTHDKEFPLLAKFYRAHCAFPATSTASERIFNIEGMVVTKYRKSLVPNRAASLVVTKDFLKKRQNEECFRLCKECYNHQPSTSVYVKNCPKHNS